MAISEKRVTVSRIGSTVIELGRQGAPLRPSVPGSHAFISYDAFLSTDLVKFRQEVSTLRPQWFWLGFTFLTGRFPTWN